MVIPTPPSVLVNTVRREDAQAFVVGKGPIFGVQRQCHHVPVEDMLRSEPLDSLNLGPSSLWYRIKRVGLHQGDLALCDSPDNHQQLVNVLVVPRLAKTTLQGKRKKGHAAPPPRALFVPDTAVDLTVDFRGLSAEEETRLRREKAPTASSDGFYEFDGQSYFYGLLELELKRSELQPEPHPGPQERALFDRALCDALVDLGLGISDDLRDAEAVLRKTADALAPTNRSWAVSLNDVVEVTRGEWQGRWGKVQDVQSDFVQVELTAATASGWETRAVSFALDDLRPYFAIGDGVKVVSGLLQGQIGHVVAVNAAVLTVSCKGRVNVPGTSAPLVGSSLSLSLGGLTNPF